MAAAEPVEEERLPAQGLAALGQGAERGVGQGDVGVAVLWCQSQTRDHGPGQFRAVGV